MCQECPTLRAARMYRLPSSPSSNPAVTCAIPATSRVDHMRENMGAARGRLPDTAMRQRMIRYVESL